MAIAAVVQMNSTDSVAANLSTATACIHQAADQGASLVLLPECFALMQRNRQQLLDHAETLDHGPIQDALQQAANDNTIWVIGGSLPLKSDDAQRVYNSSLVYDQHGNRVARYDKIHLFDVDLAERERYAESDYTAAGQALQVVDTPLGKVGLSVCYDLRFPEMYRCLVARGAQIFSVPSAFTVPTGQAHWQCLLSARAIENACYVLAAAQTGQHPSGRVTYGHSMAIDPWGRVLHQLPAQCGNLLATVDLDALALVRQQLPSLAHRRADLFG